MGRTRNQIIDEATDAYLSQLDPDNPPEPEQIAIDLQNEIENGILMENQLRGKGLGFRVPDALLFDQIALLLNHLYPIVRISCAGANADADYDLLGLYVSQGPDTGIYTTSEEEIYKLARRFNRRLTSKDFDEVLRVLRTIVPRVARCTDRDMIAVNNGVFNFATKVLMPFDPGMVFTAKSHVNYNDQAANITIHNDKDDTDWDVEGWISELSDDPEVIDLLWQILGAIIRPHVRWNKSAWLYSEEGNNGKGTLCTLMRNLCGDTAWASIPIGDFGKDFLLEPLTHATAIIVDENDVGQYIDKAANLKAVITNDVIPINRKHKTPISYQFFGFMVQCLNEFPRVKDKSDSWYRRQLFIPFTKCFNGVERRYIKDDYLARPEVLEYVMYRVLNMDYYELSEPESCKAVLDEYKEFNDPVRQFFEEMEYAFQWDLLPFGFLYELYKSWLRKNNPAGLVQGKNKFIQEIVNVSKGSSVWYCIDKTKTIRSQGRMNGPEPLIATYGLEDWKSPTYVGNDPDRMSCPKLADFYRGLLRYDGADAPPDGEGGGPDADTD